VTDVNELVTIRKNTHGDFTDHARVTQRLKQVVHDEMKTINTKVTHVQLEALQMILHKIGRIVAGDPNFKDHWDDIAGYAKITAERLPK
jgi:hypothetical protein